MNDKEFIIKALEGMGVTPDDSKHFYELIQSIDWRFVEEIFEEGFKIGAFKRFHNRNAVRWTVNGKVYEIQRFET